MKPLTPWIVLVLGPTARVAAQLAPPPAPPGNPITLEKAMLGKALFWDEQLSSTRTVACGTCHAASAGGRDPRAALGRRRHPGPDGSTGTEDDILGSEGVVRSLATGALELEVPFGFGLDPQVTPRAGLPVLMAAYAPELRWDGLAGETFRDPVSDDVLLPAGAGLESQAVLPIRNAAEMSHLDRTWEEVVARLADSHPLALAGDLPADLAGFLAGRDYPELFDAAFGPGGITPARVAMAIATYERTLVPDQTPLDAWLAGDTTALTALEQTGLALFQSSTTDCATCHPLPLLTNHAFEYVGVRPAAEDRGRFYATTEKLDKGRMRVPSLRNVELSGPYFHTGGLATLEEVIEFFDRGGDFDEPQKSPLVRPLGLTPEEKEALVAFLRRPLTDARLRDELAPFDAPQLYALGEHVPAAVGGALPGAGGFAPRAVALEPPRIGNPSFTVGVVEALGGAPAWLAFDARISSGGPGAVRLGPDAFLLEVPALAGEGPGAGWGSVSLAIPDDPALVGRTIEAQWWVRDPAAAGGIALSERVRIGWY